MRILVVNKNMKTFFCQPDEIVTGPEARRHTYFIVDQSFFLCIISQRFVTGSSVLYFQNAPSNFKLYYDKSDFALFSLNLLGEIYGTNRCFF